MSAVTVIGRIDVGCLGPVLTALGARWGHLERRLFQALFVEDRPLAEVKRAFIARYRISARQFNGLRINLGGKVQAWRTAREEQRDQLREACRKLRDKVSRLESDHQRLTRKLAVFHSSRACQTPQKERDRRARIGFQLHQKKRRLHALELRAEAVAKALAGMPALCFGGRALFRQQFHLKENGFADHAGWLQAWRARRSNQFFAVGSGEEVRGNGKCQLAPDFRHLRLRLPNALVPAVGAKHLELPVDFYRDLDLQAALERHRPISYRFLRGAQGWSVHASMEREPAPVATRMATGAIGADLNEDHVAVAELDRFGNCVSHHRLDLVLRDLTRDQAQARIGDEVARLVGLARDTGKLLVIEALDFRKKKAALRELAATRARGLSSFVFARFQAMVQSRCEREGVALYRVNPAFTSVIGFAKFGSYSLSTHQAAALAIGRRGMGLGEALKARSASPRLGEALATALREIGTSRKAGEHVWKAWKALTPWLRQELRKRTCPRSVQGGGASHPGADSSPPVTIRPARNRGSWTPVVPAVGTAAPT
jgi:IS605 OrfB family transposase